MKINLEKYSIELSLEEYMELVNLEGLEELLENLSSLEMASELTKETLEVDIIEEMEDEELIIDEEATSAIAEAISQYILGKDKESSTNTTLGDLETKPKITWIPFPKEPFGVDILGGPKQTNVNDLAQTLKYFKIGDGIYENKGTKHF